MKAKNVLLIIAFVSIVFVLFSFTSAGASVGSSYKDDPSLSAEENAKLRLEAEALEKEKKRTEKEAAEARARYAQYKASKMLSIDSGEGGTLVNKELNRILSDVKNRNVIYNDLGIDGNTEIYDFLTKYGTYFFGGDADEGWNKVIRESRQKTLTFQNSQGTVNAVDAIFPRSSVQLDLLHKRAKADLIAPQQRYTQYQPITAEQIRQIKDYMDLTAYGMRDFYGGGRMTLQGHGVKHWKQLDSIDGNEQTFIKYSDFHNFLKYMQPLINEYYSTAKLDAIENLRKDGFLFNGFDIAPSSANQDAQRDAAANAINTGRNVRDKMNGGN